MHQILRSDWLPGPSGQNAAILPTRDCLLCSRKKKFPLKPDLDLFSVKDGASVCYCAYVLRISRYPGFLICPPIQQYFCAVYDYVKKADLSKGYQNPKRKHGVTAHCSETIELKFGKKLPRILCILTLF